MVAADQVGDPQIPEPGLRVEVRHGDDWTVVELSGDLDLAGMGGAAEAFDAAFSGGGDGGILIDLSGLTFMGSEGIRVVLRTLERAEAAGRPLRVVAGDGAARRLIDLVGLGPRLGVEGDPA